MRSGTPFFRFVALVFLVLILGACDRVLEKELKSKRPLSIEDFRTTESFKVHYDLFVPSSFSGWGLVDDRKMRWDPSSMSYRFSVRVGDPNSEALGPRFKITSQDWRYQFGFGRHDNSLDSSTFGVPNRGAVLRLGFYTVGTSDLRVEFSDSAISTIQDKFINIEIKILEQSARPNAWMYVSLSDTPQ